MSAKSELAALWHSELGPEFIGYLTSPDCKRTFISLRNRPIAAEDVKRNIKVLQCAVMVYPAVVPSKYTLAADLVEFDCKLNGFV